MPANKAESILEYTSIAKIDHVTFLYFLLLLFPQLLEVIGHLGVLT
jgi:hypothetical protein